MSEQEPLVSVGIPTYERAATLRRAAESVLAQSYRNIELVICDDGSRDATESVGRALAERDERVRYVRSQSNLGLAANHNKLFSLLRGQYSMLLSDDDWLEGDYVEQCLAELRADPECVLVCGAARYVKDGERVVGKGIVFDLDEPAPTRRIKRYLHDVDENGLLYGLMPRTALTRAAPMRDVLGCDWLVVMAVLAQGKARTVQSTAILREPGGASADFAKLTATLRLPRWQAYVPHIVIAWQVLADIGWRAPVYRSLTPASRAALMLTAPWAAVRWRSLAWHMTMPVFAALGRRSGGRWLWRGYMRVVRAAGGGKSLG